MKNNIPSNEFFFAGHQSFHLRYTWLPKAADYLKHYSNVSLSNYDKLMHELGLGKNMAQSLRHWAESSQLFIKQKDNNHTFTDIGSQLFNYDPYLERIETNWLLHYLIVSNHKKNSLWYYLFNVFNEQIIIKDEFLFAATNWFNDNEVSINPRTLEKDFQCCINMYDCSKTNSKRIVDDLLSSPLKELRLLKKVGQYYHLRTIEKQEVSSGIFSYCLLDYLNNQGNQNSTPFSDLLNGSKSPGRIFRINEPTLIEYLKELKKYTKGYDFDNTAGMQQLIKVTDKPINRLLVLKNVYA